MSGAPISVSDHALYRWMQRTGLLDMEPLKNALAHSLERAAAAANQLESAHYLILADGLIYVVRNQVLVTVLPDQDQHAHVRAMRHEQPHRPEPDADA